MEVGRIVLRLIQRLPKEYLTTMGLPVLVQYEFYRIQALPNDCRSATLFVVGQEHNRTFKFNLTLDEKFVSPTCVPLTRVEPFSVIRLKLLPYTRTPVVKKVSLFLPRMRIYFAVFIPSRAVFSELFVMQPSLKRLFDIAELDVQRRAFVSMLLYIISNIDVDQLFSTLSQLGLYLISQTYRTPNNSKNGSKT